MTMLDSSPTNTALPTRRLGRTDMAITRVGFGAWAIGGPDWAFGWGTQDDKDSIAAIRHAIERGVNWIDTAAVYGLGHSEEVVCKALAGMSATQRPYVFTKCGLVWDENNRQASPRRIGAPASIKREVELSLRRLGVERIDLYQMHWPAEDGNPVEVYWQAMLDLKKEGKVRAVGLSNHIVAQLEAVERLGHVDSLQPPFSAIRREAAAAELPWCEAHKTGVIVYSPMQSGLLSGRFSLARAKALPADDWRSRSAEYSGEKLARNLRLADALKPIAEHHRTSVAAVAVAWTLAWPGVTGAIVGARSPAQVDGWIGAGSLRLTKDDMKKIAAAIEASGAGSGPTMPIS
jgi:aryl-alcohol dehydrogenase-like predicted oxidoreductase